MVCNRIYWTDQALDLKNIIQLIILLKMILSLQFVQNNAELNVYVIIQKAIRTSVLFDLIEFFVFNDKL